MTRFELLVGAQAFWARAAEDFAAARRRLYVQAMTFEGDAAGQAVARAMSRSGAADRRVLVDDYTRHVINDRFVHGLAARRDSPLQREVRDTDEMFRGLVRAGAQVRVTNSVGPLFVFYPARNHKKMIVADDVAYVGGVNFSDHNFAWHDFMLRLEGAQAADFLAADFLATFESRARPDRADLGGLTLVSLDGRSNAQGFAVVMDLITGARRQITAVSPYLTFPFTEALAAARARGVGVRLITPLANNKAALRDYLLAAADRGGFEVCLTPGMSHLKGMLIDDERLIVGSSNFDFVSLGAEDELLAVVADRDVIETFRRSIVDPAMAQALPPGAHRASRLRGAAAHLSLRLADGVVALSRYAKREAVDWR